MNEIVISFLSTKERRFSKILINFFISLSLNHRETTDHAGAQVVKDHPENSETLE